MLSIHFVVQLTLCIWWWIHTDNGCMTWGDSLAWVQSKSAGLNPKSTLLWNIYLTCPTWRLGIEERGESAEEARGWDRRRGIGRGRGSGLIGVWVHVPVMAMLWRCKYTTQYQVFYEKLCGVFDSSLRCMAYNHLFTLWWVLHKSRV